MGKKAKVGKSRKDRFYHLAKETGYRSRSAFKLIQLNRKFEFLQKSNVIIDLCAAPGGWLQVAAANAPMSNHIIGIDLDPINPIKNVTTLIEDITTEKCRLALKKELISIKADIVLNDGAPNVGKNWVYDSYQQAELTLYALKLATEFLRKGGWFVTKIFRSKDYDSLLWVFNQLFKSVHATKPQASRNESAEIFVVCQHYIAPDKIDPKFLNPKYAFSDVTPDKKVAIDLIHPAKIKRQREGYPEGDYTLFHSLSAVEFLASSNYMDLLAESSEIKLDSEEIANHPLTTAELKECMKDIKLLGKKELKALFKWRNKLKKLLEAEEDSDDDEVEENGDSSQKENGIGEDDGDEDLMEEEKELAELEKLVEEKNLQELKAMKKAKKKVKKDQTKQKTRIDLKMAIPGDKIDIQGDISMFNIQKIKSKGDLSELSKGDLTHMDKEDMFDDSDDDTRQPKRQSFDRGEKKYIGFGDETDSEDEMEEEPTFEDNDDIHIGDDSDESAAEDDEITNPLLVDMGVSERVKKAKEETWFNKSVFADLEKDADEDVELGQMGLGGYEKKARKKNEKKAKKMASSDGESSEEEDSSGEEESSGDEEADGAVKDDIDEESDSNEDTGDESDYDYMEANSLKKGKKNNAAKTKGGKKTDKFDGIEVVPAVTSAELQLDEQGLAIGTAMVQSRKRRREIIESGYHRYMYDDGANLPEWFLEDDQKHTKRQMPITKEEVQEIRMKAKAIDAQPIKKVAEAKARKKKKMLKSLEKARKKASAISDNVDVSEKEKWNQMKHVYKKAGLLNKVKESVTYVKAKKGAGKKVSRPAGVKGKFKVVDSRMKKDVLGQKKAEMRKQKGSNSKKAQKRQSMSKGPGKRRVRR